MVIGVSQSGEAEDVCTVVSKAKQQGAVTIALTNNLNSPLAKLADHTLDLAVEKEISVAATKTYSAELVLLACLARVLEVKEIDFSDIYDTLSLIELILKDKENIAKVVKQLTQKSNVYVLARGYVYTVAKELALKMQETSYVQALSYASSDFYHGPIAMIDDDSFIIMLMPDDESYDDNHKLLDRISKLSNKVLVITDNDNIDFDNVICIPKTKPEFSPILFAITAQLFALKLAISNGYNPDKPRNLNKVTITR